MLRFSKVLLITKSCWHAHENKYINSVHDQVYYRIFPHKISSFKLIEYSSRELISNIIVGADIIRHKLN